MTVEVTMSGLSDGDDSDVEEVAPWGREDSKLEKGGRIPFFKYDPLFRSVNADAVPLTSCVRLFAGQLPYQMPPSAVAWFLWVATGVHVVRVEKIVRWTNNRQPCGCFHVYVLPQDESLVLAANELALFDGDGVWVAKSALQLENLRSLCGELQSSAELRVRGFPYNMVTLQRADSTYSTYGGRPALQSANQRQQGEMEVRVTFDAPPAYNVSTMEVPRPPYSVCATVAAPPMWY